MKTIQTSWPNPQTAPPASGNGGGKVMQPMKNISSRPNGSPSTGGGVERPVTLWGVLDAFRRRWIPALAIGIPLALLVAGLLWQSIPAEFESTALIRINQNESRLVDKSENQQTGLLTYRDSQISFMKSDPVLEAALNENGIRDTQLLKGNPYPLEFLKEFVEVGGDLSDEYIRITLAGEYPEDIQRVVNAIKGVYMDKVVYNAQQDKQEALDTVKRQRDEAEARVAAHQDRIDRLAKELGTTSDPETGAMQLQLKLEKIRLMQQRLGDLNQKVRQADAMQRIAREAGVSPNQIPGLYIDGNSTTTSPSPANNHLATLRQAIQIVDAKINRYRSTVRDPNHPKVVELKNQREQLQKQLARQGTGGTTSAGGALSSYEVLLRERSELLEDISEAEENYAILNNRMIDLRKEDEIIAPLLAHRDNLRTNVASRETELEAPPRVSVIQDANLPKKRNIKARVQASFLGGFATFFTIVAGFTMFEWFSHRVGSTSDIANAVNLRLVGTIPSPDKGGLLGLGVFAGKVDYDEWNRAVIESMDVVRTYLMRHVDPSRPASILVTSASANEGKTTVSCQLAASLARAGKRVAIVDCDFRRPSAHVMMDGQEGPGICEYLRGECSMESIYQQTQAPGLTFIPAGQVDQQVLQTLSSDGGRSLISDLKSRFEFVIIDTSPLLFVAEPSMLAQNADIVLLSTRKDYSRIPYVAQSRDSLRSLQVPLLGAVMVGSDSDFQRQSYGYRQRLQPVANSPMNETFTQSAAPMQAAPMQAAPTQAAPMQAAPMQAAPTQAAPMQAAPMQAAPMQAAPMQAAPMQASPPVQPSTVQTVAAQLAPVQTIATPKAAGSPPVLTERDVVQKAANTTLSSAIDSAKARAEEIADDYIKDSSV